MAITNIQLAQLLGLDESMISRLRSGQRLPSPNTMLKISKVFGVDGGKILTARVKGMPYFARMFNDMIDKYQDAESTTTPTPTPTSTEPKESDD